MALSSSRASQIMPKHRVPIMNRPNAIYPNHVSVSFIRGFILIPTLFAVRMVVAGFAVIVLRVKPQTPDEFKHV